MFRPLASLPSVRPDPRPRRSTLRASSVPSETRNQDPTLLSPFPPYPFALLTSLKRMKSLTGSIAVLAVLLSSSLSGVDAQLDRKQASRSRSHHNHASALIVKTSIQKRATPTGWTSQGCVTEGTSSARVLTGYSAQGLSSLTVESCLATCASMAYTYGGLECECLSSSLGRGWRSQVESGGRGSRPEAKREGQKKEVSELTVLLLPLLPPVASSRRSFGSRLFGFLLRI